MAEGGVEQISTQDFLREIGSYRAGERDTQRTVRRCICSHGLELEIPVFLNHFWPRNQKAGSLHRIASEAASVRYRHVSLSKGSAASNNQCMIPTWAAEPHRLKPPCSAGFLWATMPI